MSVTGFWVVGVVPDRAIAHVRRESPGAVAFGRQDPECNGTLKWWRGRSAQESFFDPSSNGPVPTEQALRLQGALDTMRPVDDQYEAIKEELLQLVPQGEGVGLFCASTRKGDPFGALDYALGPEVMAQFPGWCGDFLLDVAEVRAALPGAEVALGLSPERRGRVEERIRDWLEGMTDGAAHDLDDLVDGPLRVLRHAAQHGFGAAGLTLWY